MCRALANCAASQFQKIAPAFMTLANQFAENQECTATAQMHSAGRVCQCEQTCSTNSVEVARTADSVGTVDSGNSPTTDKKCSCKAGHFFDKETYLPCTVGVTCAAAATCGQYTCTPCAICDPYSQYETQACQAAQGLQTQCSPVLDTCAEKGIRSTARPELHYQAPGGGPTRTSDRKCFSHEVCDQETDFINIANIAKVPRPCQTLTTCNANSRLGELATCGGRPATAATSTKQACLESQGTCSVDATVTTKAACTAKTGVFTSTIADAYTYKIGPTEFVAPGGAPVKKVYSGFRGRYIRISTQEVDPTNPLSLTTGYPWKVVAINPKRPSLARSDIQPGWNEQSEAVVKPTVVFFSGEDPAKPAASVIDGDATTAWQSDPTKPNLLLKQGSVIDKQWIVLDMKEDQTVEQVDILQGTLATCGGKLTTLRDVQGNIPDSQATCIGRGACSKKVCDTPGCLTTKAVCEQKGSWVSTPSTCVFLRVPHLLLWGILSALLPFHPLEPSG